MPRFHSWWRLLLFLRTPRGVPVRHPVSVAAVAAVVADNPLVFLLSQLIRGEERAPEAAATALGGGRSVCSAHSANRAMAPAE